MSILDEMQDNPDFSAQLGFHGLLIFIGQIPQYLQGIASDGDTAVRIDSESTYVIGYSGSVIAKPSSSCALDDTAYDLHQDVSFFHEDSIIVGCF